MNFNKPETIVLIIKILEITEEELNSIYLTPNTRGVLRFKLKQRALHVYEEAQRVEKFLDVCRSDSTDDDKLQLLGKLMNQSHESLRTNFECSHKALDELVDSCLKAGAYGARLTGAGWGGCVVALSDKSQSELLLRHVKDTFYSNKNFTKDLIFTTKPQCGAMIFRCDDRGACEIIKFD